jgi:DNA polymerase-3 subunit epsilon
MDALVWLLVVAVCVAIWIYFRVRPRPVSLAHLPERFIVLDLETTGLAAGTHEIIEIGAIRVNRDSTNHETYQALVKPKRRIPKKITEITGITQEMVNAEGVSLHEALADLAAFVGNHRIITFNAEFDIAFLHAAASEVASARLQNSVSCALKMARRAWPGRQSYRLADLARDGNLSSANQHRALGDCERALIVYTAASSRLRSAS